MAQIFEGKDGKERKDLEDSELKKCMPRWTTQLDADKAVLDIYRDSKDLNAFYGLISSSIEKGWLAYFGGTREFNKQAKGRVKVTSITTKPKKQKEVQEDEFPTTRNQASKDAVAALKQARRLVQVAYRLGLIQIGASREKIERYQKLNEEAIENVKTNA